MVLDDEVFLAAEPAADVSADDVHALGRDTEDADDPLVVVVDPLRPGVDGHPAVAVRDREGALGLHEGVLGLGRPERLPDDVRRGGDRGVRVAALQDRFREEVSLRVELRGVVVEGLPRVDEGREGLVVEAEALHRLLRNLARLGRDEGERVADVARLLADGDHCGPVGDDVPLEAFARDVGGGHHRHDARHRERLGRVDPEDFHPRLRRPEDRSVEHPGDLQVVDVLRPADDLLPRVGAEDLRADGEGDGVLVGDRLSLAEEARRVEDPLLDLHVAGAAAHAELERFRDLLGGRFRPGVDEPLGRHHHPRHAEAALDRPRVREGPGVDVLLALGEPFDGHDALSGDLRRRREAGAGRRAVHEDHAGPARPLGAAVLDRREVQLLAEERQELRVARSRDLRPVHAERDRSRALRGRVHRACRLRRRHPSLRGGSSLEPRGPVRSGPQRAAVRSVPTSSGARPTTAW